MNSDSAICHRLDGSDTPAWLFGVKVSCVRLRVCKLTICWLRREKNCQLVRLHSRTRQVCGYISLFRRFSPPVSNYRRIYRCAYVRGNFIMWHEKKMRYNTMYLHTRLRSSFHHISFRLWIFDLLFFRITVESIVMYLKKYISDNKNIHIYVYVKYKTVSIIFQINLDLNHNHSILFIVNVLSFCALNYDSPDYYSNLTAVIFR